MADLTADQVRKATPEVLKLLQRAALHVVRDGFETEDLVQEGWLAAVGSLNRYNPSLGLLSAFVWTTSTNRMRDFMRLRLVEKRTTPLHRAQDSEDGVGELLYDPPVPPLQEQKLLVQEILAALTPHQKLICRLVLLSGLTQAEAAARLGVSQQAISKNIVRIRQKVLKLGSKNPSSDRYMGRNGGETSKETPNVQ